MSVFPTVGWSNDVRTLKIRLTHLHHPNPRFFGTVEGPELPKYVNNILVYFILKT